MEYDLTSKIKTNIALSAQTIATNTTTVGATIDTVGYEALTFSIASATLTDGAYAVQLFAGDASDMSDEAQVTSEIIGTVPSFASTDDNTIKYFGTYAKKRYFRIKIVSKSTTSGGALSAQAILGHAKSAPTV